jgi:site-specific recombinase XerD
MKVRRTLSQETNDTTFELLDDVGRPIEIVSRFMRHLRARDYSPNTQSAYCFDLLHFMTFLKEQQLTYEQFTPAHAWSLLEYLRELPSRIQAQRLGPVLCTTDQGRSATCLSATTINRILATVSSFYEYLIVADLFQGRENPIHKVDDPALARVSERHRPFMGSASRQRPIRRAVRVKTVQRVPRPMSEEQIAQLRGSLRPWRDKAMILLMLQGGLRPGEVLCLQLADVEYGRRRVVIRYRTDHPKRARTKSRTERVVDLLEPETLQTLNAYVMHERPKDSDSPFVFLVGGRGKRRCEPLGYHALVKLFERHCDRLGIREPWITPHALRHTHATTLWESGMRELSLQKRLGHASPESTRVYTRVSDAVVVAEYKHALGEEQQP